MAGTVFRSVPVLLVLCSLHSSLLAQTEPFSAELGSHAGVIDNEYAVGGSFLFNLTRCAGIEASLDAVIDDDGSSDLIASGNIIYGLWYCCIPAYYVKFVYLTAGIGTFNRIGRGERFQDTSFNFGMGAKISLNSKLGLRGEVKDFVVISDFVDTHLWAYRIGLDFRL